MTEAGNNTNPSTINVEVVADGFRVTYHDILIIIKDIGKNTWNYEFYKNIFIDDNINMEPSTAPFSAKGNPWITGRYKDSLFTNCMQKTLFAEKEEAQRLVQEIIAEIFKVHEAYTSQKNYKTEVPEVEEVDKILMRYAKDFELFHDEKKVGYAKIQYEDHYEVYQINSEEFSDVLRKKYLEEYHSVVKKFELESVIETISALAKFNGKEYKLHVRICKHEDAIWFDLGNWKAVKITKEGWTIENNPPILFRHFSNQKPYNFEIKKDGNSRDIFKLVRLNHDNQAMLYLIDLCTKFVPGIQHVADSVSGDAGSGKSSKVQVQKRLVDWCENDFIRLSKNPEETIQNMSHTYYAVFDNLSYITGDQSDLLATAVTGGSGARRVLYKQDSDFIYNYKLCIGMTGINVVVNRPDLIERSILFEEGKSDEYMSETEFWDLFNNLRGSILGGIFNAVSEAMKHKNQINVVRDTRMVDFVEWGCSFAVALGYTQEEFVEAYAISCSKLNRNLLDNNTIGRILIKFMEGKSEWEGTMEKLLTELKMISSLLGFEKGSGFPNSPIVLSKKYNELRNNLEKLGIQKIDTDKSERKFKLINKNFKSEKSGKKSLFEDENLLEQLEDFACTRGNNGEINTCICSDGNCCKQRDEILKKLNQEKKIEEPKYKCRVCKNGFFKIHLGFDQGKYNPETDGICGDCRAKESKQKSDDIQLPEIEDEPDLRTEAEIQLEKEAFERLDEESDRVEEEIKKWEHEVQIPDEIF